MEKADAWDIPIIGGLTPGDPGSSAPDISAHSGTRFEAQREEMSTDIHDPDNRKQSRPEVLIL